jgi:hypothetical protein
MLRPPIADIAVADAATLVTDAPRPSHRPLRLGSTPHASSVCMVPSRSISERPSRSIVKLPSIRTSLRHCRSPFPGNGILRSRDSGVEKSNYTQPDRRIFRQAITSNGGRSAVARVAHLFCEQFTRARAVGSMSGWSCPFPLSQTQIGQLVGLSLPTVNRATQLLRKQNCAEVRGGELRILNWRRLSRQAGFDPLYLHADLGERS